MALSPAIRLPASVKGTLRVGLRDPADDRILAPRFWRR